MSLFDECFAAIPDLSQIPGDYELFWQKRLEELRRIPQEVSLERKASKKFLSENSFSLSFQSAGKFRLHGFFWSPRKFMGKPPVVVIFPDYNKSPVAYRGLFQAGLAQFVLYLRGQKEFELYKGESNEKSPAAKRSPGYFGENLLAVEKYYMVQLLLDAYRALEVIRLRKEVDTSRIGIWGIGIGAAMALFVSRFMQRTTSLFLENPAFAFLELTQNLSQADYAREINEAAKNLKKYKNLVKQNLAYSDAVVHALNLAIPTTMAIRLFDKENVPHGGFAVFHLLQGDKEMHLFLDEQNETSLATEKKIRQLAIRFFESSLLGTGKTKEATQDAGTFAV
ncbi:MAG: acetylxylan esterase [Leptospiraceae bacterium]|nr:acetylxylan esterase [Leptospiraceae bacterium]MDW8307080.1 acetylxylan esterase [Leptospiraceae bacterium]